MFTCIGFAGGSPFASMNTKTGPEKRRTAVVTGAEGFIGSNLTRELLRQGWEVIALHLPNGDLTRLLGVPAVLRPCNVLNPQDLEDALPENADALFHLAADVRITSRRTTEQSSVNLGGTKNVIEAALKKKTRRFLYTSSMAAFGLHDQRIDETTPSNAMQLQIPYFRSKYRGEIEIDKAIARGLDAVIVNPANVVGPGDIKNMPAIFIRLVRDRKMPIMGSGQASFCHVEDIAKSMVACIECGRIGERYLLGGEDATFLEMGRIIEQVVGGRAPRLVLPRWAFRAVGRLLDGYARFRGAHSVLTKEMALVLSSTMLVDSSKAASELGHSTSTLKKMVDDEVNWLSDQGLFSGSAKLVWA